MNISPELRVRYDHLIVHCWATPPSLDADASWVNRAHRQRGFNGCGYHAVILRDGTIQDERNGAPTRPYSRSGAHVGGCGPGWNRRAIGVSLAGGVKEDGKTPEDNFTDAQKASLQRYITWALGAFDIPVANVMGHRDLIKLTNASPKACPCFSVRDFLTGHRANIDQPTKPRRPERTENKTLRVPRYYTVVSGDTLWGLSRAWGTSVKEIVALNNLPTTAIDVGQKLRMRN